MLLVFAMAVSCVCAVACSNKNENKTCKHDYEETVVAATCTTGGYTEHKCSKCGDTYKDNEVAALGHDMTDWAEKTPATCTAAEVLEKHCKRTGCDYEETKDGEAALGHDMKWTTTLKPTCTEDGKQDGACQRTGCDYTETDVKIDKLGHNYVESTTDPKAKAATCTEDGLKVEICANEGCNDNDKRKETVIPAFGHTDDETKAVVTAPTCTEQGYTTRHCETCGQDYEDDYVNELGHEMALEQTVKVSCLTDGYELWKCERTNCEYSEKREEEDKLDHVFDADGNCKSGCGKTINDKLTWVNTKYDVTYNESADRLTLIGGDPCSEGSIAPKDQTNYKSITIPAAVIAARKKAGYSTFALAQYRLPETTPQFGFCFDESTFAYSENNVDYYISKVITIDDDMLQNGYKFIASYTDLTQRDAAWGGTKICDGFIFDVKFYKDVDMEDKSTWFYYDFDACTVGESGTLNLIGAGDRIKLSLRKEVVAAMVAEGKTAVSYAFARLNPKEDTGFVISGYEGLPGRDNGKWNHTFEINDDIKVNGLNLILNVFSCNWGGEWVAPTGCSLTITFIKPTETITLNAENTTYTYDGVVGYDGTIAEFNVSSITDNGAGGTYFMVGSYGVYYRGGQYRLVSLTGGAYSEVSGAERKGATVSLNKGGKVGVSVTVKDDNTVTVSVYENGTLLTSWDVSRVSDEVTSAEASATVKIASSYVTECVLSK